jgi:PHD/YefM family antitoxin component YafN of YafNO toxin-antitoxin module
MHEDTTTRKHESTTARKSTYSISEIREAITRLPEQFEQDTDVVNVTRHGKSVMTILPTSTYETLIETIDSLLETLEVMADEELMAAFRRGVQELAAGRGKPWEEVKRELNLE